MKIYRYAAWVVGDNKSGYLSDLLFHSEQEMHRVINRVPEIGKVIPVPVVLEVPDDIVATSGKEDGNDGRLR